MYPVVYERTVFVPLNGESTFMCNVSGGDALLYVKNLEWWWPGFNASNLYLRCSGINAQYVDPSRPDAVTITVNGSAPNLGGAVITCCCYDSVQLQLMYSWQQLSHTVRTHSVLKTYHIASALSPSSF